jgi:hypothetical protein
MPTVKELAAELGIPEDTLKAHADVVSKYDGIFTSADTKSRDAQEAITRAEKAMQDANDLQAVIDNKIDEYTSGETNNASLRATIKAQQAALEELKGQGFDINLPEFGKTSATQTADDPTEKVSNLLSQFGQQFGQIMNVQNRYQQVFGKPFPDDPTRLADEAAAHRMPVSAYAEKKYGFAAEDKKRTDERFAKEKEDYASLKIKEYQEAHPNTSGNSNLQGGLPSNYPAMPKPREGADVRSFSTMSAREKMTDAWNRAVERVRGAQETA